MTLDDHNSDSDISMESHHSATVSVREPAVSNTLGANIAAHVRELDKVDYGDIENILRLVNAVRSLDRSGQ